MFLLVCRGFDLVPSWYLFCVQMLISPVCTIVLLFACVFSPPSLVNQKKEKGLQVVQTLNLVRTISNDPILYRKHSNGICKIFIVIRDCTKFVFYIKDLSMWALCLMVLVIIQHSLFIGRAVNGPTLDLSCPNFDLVGPA